MSADLYSQRPLFGGAISTTFPLRFQDVSNIRQVPDHQEVFVDPARDESLIFELLDYKHEVGDDRSAVWFLQDLAVEQDGEGFTVYGIYHVAAKIIMVSGINSMLVCCLLGILLFYWGLRLPTLFKASGTIYRVLFTAPEEGKLLEQSAAVEAPGLRYKNIPAVVTTAVGQMAVSKGRQGREAQNIIKVYLANLRLKEVGTDVLITAYEPLLINPLSESASAVGAGLAIPATQSGFFPMVEVFKQAVTSFKVNDWSLFSPTV